MANPSLAAQDRGACAPYANVMTRQAQRGPTEYLARRGKRKQRRVSTNVAVLQEAPILPISPRAQGRAQFDVSYCIANLSGSFSGSFLRNTAVQHFCATRLESHPDLATSACPKVFCIEPLSLGPARFGFIPRAAARTCAHTGDVECQHWAR